MLTSGQLLGLDNEDVLEVTNTVPIPASRMPAGGVSEEDESSEEVSGSDFQYQLINTLQSGITHLDNYSVGWYQATYLSSFLDEQMIQTQFFYQSEIKNCVCLLFDPARTNAGNLNLRAVRLTREFVEAYRGGSFTAESCDITSRNIFEDVPIQIRNSQLASALLAEMDCAPDSRSRMRCGFDRMDLGTNPFLTKNLEFLSDCLDNLNLETSKYQYWQRQVAKQQAQQQQFRMRKMQEAQAKRANGETVDEDAVADESDNPLFRPIQAPSRLESLLITNQVATYCGQVREFTGESLHKMYLAQRLNGRGEAGSAK